MELFAITTLKKVVKKLTFLKSQVLQSNISITPELQSLHHDFHKVDKCTFNSILLLIIILFIIHIDKSNQYCIFSIFADPYQALGPLSSRLANPGKK